MGTQRTQRTKSRLAAVALLLPGIMVAAGCGQQAPGGVEGSGTTVSATIPSSAAASATAPPTSGATMSAPPAAAAIDLSITLTESPGATAHQFRLVADGSTPSAESTLPDPAAAVAAVEQYGEKLFFPVPDPTRMCTDQYGGPEVAVVTGSFNGKAVNSTFSRTNGCEIASWQALAPLFGALAGGTGAS